MLRLLKKTSTVKKQNFSNFYNISSKQLLCIKGGDSDIEIPESTNKTHQ